MDLAELRKKAKSRAGSEPSLRDDQLTASADSDDQDQGPKEAPADLPSTKTGSVPLAQVDPLEELFKIPEDLHLLSVGESLAAVDEKVLQKKGTYRQWLVFSLGCEEYGLDINNIREIIKPREITDIPRVPSFILGIISLRGVVVPIYDLKKRLGLGTGQITPMTRIVVCEYEDLLAGFQVDGISQVVSLADESIESTPAMLTGLDRDLVRGIGRHDRKMTVLLDLPHILDTNFS